MDQQEGIAPDTWETDVPAAGDGPRVWITLPDQQVVMGLLLEQRQGSTSS